MAAQRKKPTSKSKRSSKASPKPKPKPKPKKTQALARREVLPQKVEALPPGLAFPIEIDPKKLEETLGKMGAELEHWANKGRYTKVRFKFRGKQLLPDLPLAAVAAAEGLTFYWGGILRALLVNVAGNSVLQVELVNDSEKWVQKGREALLSGEVEEAKAHFEHALKMQRDNPRAHLNLGVALKLKGEREAARACFERARALDPEGAVGQEAERLLR